MFSVAAVSEMVSGDGPTLREALSGIAGSTSLACWIVLLLPQLVEQWKYKSAEGISIEFIGLWLLGDIANLIGAVWADLLPQVILLAVWYCLADFLIGFSYYYYTYIYPKHHRHHHLHNIDSHPNNHQGSVAVDETSALVNRRHSSRSRRRSSIEVQVLSDNRKHIFTNIVLPVLFVLLAGMSGYFLSAETTHHAPSDGGDTPPHEKIQLGPQILGYISATLYLTARLPQIYQNYVKKSCKGLSLLFFIFSTVGNLTYALQIVLYRSDWEYIILNLSWLLGSFGTIFEDSFIFFQFWIYRDNDNPDVYLSDDEEPVV